MGPESITFDPNGEGPTPASPMAGSSNGKAMPVVGLSLLSPFLQELEHLCGRPLGLRFEKKTGNLYIADAYFGLQVVGLASGLANQVVTEAEDQPFLFTNDIHIDEHEDVIYFTDTSKSFQRRQFMASILSGDKTGRIPIQCKTKFKRGVLGCLVCKKGAFCKLDSVNFMGGEYIVKVFTQLQAVALTVNRRKGSCCCYKIKLGGKNFGSGRERWEALDWINPDAFSRHL
ncbi:hypothetical protein FH972_020020 [Carpinus fangiana]|uniref:Strictosidine synthase conserved region domain-containing protein n=1 Tax=Carpinus fangiana TaxID=176857 RepID=A0A5N6RTH5_9ROSI|nr:hypothetical protein FH972_020020 [Carpinus fangiana]